MAICNSLNPLMSSGVTTPAYSAPAHYMSPGITPTLNPNAPPIPYYYRQQAVPNGEQNQSKASNTDETARPSYRDLPSSPDRPRAPVARMSPTLPEDPRPNVANKEYQAYVQDTEQEKGYSSDDSHEDNDFAVLCTPETGMSESSSDTSSVLTHESVESVDSAANSNGNDGVIDRRPTAYSNNDHRGVAPGVDIDKSLRIGKNSGRIHLGPQWQVPKASTTQSNAGPKFGQARDWIAHKNERLANHPDSELIDIYCDKAVEADIAAPFKSSADTSCPEDILRLRHMHLGERPPVFSGFYRDRRERRGPMAASAPTDNVVGSTKAAADSSPSVTRAYPIPTNLSMSGASRSGLSGSQMADLDQASKRVRIKDSNRLLLCRTLARQSGYASQHKR
ncbi:hypothetical protein GGR58DRAFT_504014 [Xylaria digitata]|nr:hypothetical protein GGR58DRAFT_504014 [Xylaria digitata]